MAWAEVKLELNQLFGVQEWGRDCESRSTVGWGCCGTRWSHTQLWSCPQHLGWPWAFQLPALWKPHLELHPRGQVWTSASWRLTRLHPQAPACQGIESRSLQERETRSVLGWGWEYETVSGGEDAHNGALIPVLSPAASQLPPLLHCHHISWR